MKKKEFLVYTAMTLIPILLMVVVASSNENPTIAKSNKAENNYQIVLNSANSPASLSESSLLALANHTPSRYVEWEYKNVKKSSGAHVLLHGDATEFGSLRNVEPIQGIVGVDVSVSNSASVELLGSYSPSGIYEPIYVFSTGNESYEANIPQPYLKLQAVTATEDVIVAEVSVTYSCLTHPATTDHHLANFKEVGDFESGNAWEVTGTSDLVSVSSSGAYFNNNALLIQGWVDGSTIAADLALEYHVGVLTADTYTFVIGANLTHANVDIYVNETKIGALANPNNYGSGLDLVEGFYDNSTRYNGRTLDWTWMRFTHQFTLAENEDVTIRLEIATDDYFVDGNKTTWGLLDGIKIIRGTNYLEDLYLKIPDAAITINETLTTATVGATLFNHSYPTIGASNIVFTTESPNLTIIDNVITGKTISATNLVVATINYGVGLVESVTFNVQVSGLLGDFLTTINTINAAGTFEASDWSVVTAGWTHLSSTTQSYLSDKQANSGTYSIRPNGDSGLPSDSYSLYYISDLSFKANMTYTISYYYFNSGRISLDVGVSSAVPATDTEAINTTALSGWDSTLWIKVSFTYSPGASDLTNQYFFIRMVGNDNYQNGYGFIDTLQIEAK